MLTFNPARHPSLPTSHLSLACNHCDTPACLLECPAAAYRRDAATGAVLLDAARCLGCRYCAWVCPYDAPRFDATRGVMTKCTFCAPRLAAGGEPACTALCPTGALSLGEHRPAAAEPTGPGLRAWGLGPALRLIAPRRRGPPQIAPSPATIDPSAARVAHAIEVAPPMERQVRLAAEWPLIAFTVALPALAAACAAGVLRPERAPALALFLLCGVAALALSTLHLGQPQRAWRAALNLRSSWLSREVVAAHALLGLGTVQLLAPPGSTLAHLAGGLAVAAGVALAVAIDGVYRAVPRLERPGLHPAEITLAAPFLFALFAGMPPLALAVATLRALLLVVAARRHAWGLGAAWATLRLALLAAACAPAIPWPLPALVALAGEALDRTAFVAALEPASPRRAMALFSPPARPG